MRLIWIILSVNLTGLFLLLQSNGFPARYVPQVHQVEIKGMAFQPAELKVRKGDIVVWINRDMVPHDVTEEKKKAWTSSPIPSGKTWRIKVTQSAYYFCSIHQVMKGRIVVQ